MDKLANILRGAHLKAKKIINKTPTNLSLSSKHRKCFDGVHIKSHSANTQSSGPKPLNLISSGASNTSLFNKFWICCKESRIESPNNFYGCFYIGPFDESLSQTLAHNIRRTLLSELSGLAITAVEIEGVSHKFSNLPGVQETVLDIICNLQNLVFKKNLDNQVGFLNSTVAYLRLRGPGVVKAADIILPSGVQCVNPDQYIATLSEDGILNMKIYINEGKNYIKQKQKNSFAKAPEVLFGYAHKSSNNLAQFELEAQPPQPITNKIYLDSVFMPVTKVNTIVQNNNKCTDDVLENNLLFKLSAESLSSAATSNPEQNSGINNTGFSNTEGFQSTVATFGGNAASFEKTGSTSKDSKPEIKVKGASKQIMAEGHTFFTTKKRSAQFLTEELQSNTTSASGFGPSHTARGAHSIVEPFIALSDINKKQQSKQCHIVIEIWTNGSIHPRKALYDCLAFLSRTFVTLENVKMLGSMYKSDLIYEKILKKSTKLNNYS
jgi:DNA-directed RNA polymerase alpha subunit